MVLAFDKVVRLIKSTTELMDNYICTVTPNQMTEQLKELDRVCLELKPFLASSLHWKLFT